MESYFAPCHQNSTADTKFSMGVFLKNNHFSSLRENSINKMPFKIQDWGLQFKSRTCVSSKISIMRHDEEWSERVNDKNVTEVV